MYLWYLLYHLPARPLFGAPSRLGLVTPTPCSNLNAIGVPLNLITIIMPSQCPKLIEILFIIAVSLACRSNAKRNFPAFIASDRARNSRRDGSSTPSPLYANERVYSSDLDTAFEWLATDRVEDEPGRYEGIKWFDPSAPPPITDGDESDVQLELVKMPLYPLGAVHLPHSGENYTIINIVSENAVNMRT